MPAYEINYLREDGSLTAKMETQCASDLEAKILAHAMKMKEAQQIEVWRGDTLVYARPDRGPLRVVSDAALRNVSPSHAGLN